MVSGRWYPAGHIRHAYMICRSIMATTIAGTFKMIFQYFDLTLRNRNDIPIIARVFKLLSGICFVVALL